MATRALGAAHAAAGSYEDGLQLFARMIDIAREAGIALWERMARTDWLIINLGWLTDPAALHASAPDREHLTMLQSWAENLLQSASEASPEIQLRERAATLSRALADPRGARQRSGVARGDRCGDARRGTARLVARAGRGRGGRSRSAAARGRPDARRRDGRAWPSNLRSQFDLLVVEGKAHDTLARCAEAAGDHETAVQARCVGICR